MTLRSAALALLFALSAPHAFACGIVYGDDWAFASQAPAGWVGRCGDQAPQGMNLVVLPKGRTLDDTDAVLYVSVFDKTAADLATFVREDRVNTAKQAPRARIRAVTMQDVKDRRILLARIEGAPGATYEYVAYVEGPTAYYLIVMSCDTQALLDRNRSAFVGFLNDFRPIRRTR